MSKRRKLGRDIPRDALADILVSLAKRIPVDIEPILKAAPREPVGMLNVLVRTLVERGDVLADRMAEKTEQGLLPLLVGTWYQPTARQIYVMNADMDEELQLSAERKRRLKIRTEALRLPFQTFAVSTPHLKVPLHPGEMGNVDVQGFLVHQERNELFVVFCGHNYKGDIAFGMRILHLNDESETLEECIEYTVLNEAAALESLGGDADAFLRRMVNQIDMERTIWRTVLMRLLYIGSLNADSAVLIGRRRAVRKNDKSLPALAWEVGVRRGPALKRARAAARQDTPSGPRTGRKRPPCMVCGHPAHRWVGKGRTDLRVVWIDPYPVNMHLLEGDEEPPVVLREA